MRRGISWRCTRASIFLSLTGRHATELIQEVDWYLDRLEGVEGGQGQWQAWCPCHDDIGTSMKGLSITVKGEKVLMRCHSCEATMPDVMEALDEMPAEPTPVVHITRVSNGHGPAPKGMSWWVSRTGVPEDVWASLGCEEHGDGVRFNFSDGVFKTRRPPKEISWVGTEASEAPPLWPEVTDELPEKVTITEGESDCGTAHAAGLPYAFSVTKGAKGALPRGWADALAARGVESLCIIGDADESGEQFSVRAAREATAAGLSVEVVRLETVIDPFSGINDLNGVWRACETAEEFLEVIDRATQKISARLPFLSVKEMEIEAKKEVKWLVPELIAPSDKIMIAAPQKSLKSWLALELTRSLATKTAFLKRAEWVPEREMKVGFLQEEGSKGLWARRVAMLGISSSENAVFAHRTGFRFTEASFTDEVISVAREQALDMLILDPLQRMMPGLDSNSDSDTGLVWDEVFRIQQAIPHLVVCIVHHANKTNRLTWESIRGSSRHAGEVDLGIFLERHPFEDETLRMWMDGRDIPQYLGTGEHFEVKYKIDRETRSFEMDATEISVNMSGQHQVVKADENRDKVFKAVRGGCDTRTKIMHETNLSDTTVREHLQSLMEEEVVSEVDNGKGKAKNYIPKENSE